MAHLTILSGTTRGKIVELGAQPCRVGREQGIEVTLPDTKTSRIHIEINFKDGQFFLRDMKSKNGTMVNGTAVTALTLQEGDQIQIGETRLAFSLQDVPKHPRGSPGRKQDSIMAPRLPVGVVPALGSAGLDKSGAEAFETLELNGRLAILQDEAKPEVPEAARSESESEHDSTVETEGTHRAPGIAKNEPVTPEAHSQAQERANRALRALYSLARTAAEADSSAELWKALGEGLRVALEADRVTPVLLDAKGHWDVGNPSGELAHGPAAFAKVPVSRTIVDYALRTRRSVLTSPRTDARFGNAKSIGEQGITSAICVPIISHDQILGLLYADRLGGQNFVRDDHELLTAACLQAAPALATLRRLEEAIQKKERLLKELKNQHNMLGDSPRMREAGAFIERAGTVNSVVLVLGESGTGKELVARAIHYNSRRSDAAFIVVNCAALTETLIESELFGHVKGAFTGASSDRAGRFEMAHEGTLFLDEIGELSNNCQTKLLRVLEQGELSRVGEGRVRKVDVRVLAATNRDLQAEVKNGRFREDLYYRLNVLTVSLAPLRDRGADVELLLEHYLREAALRSQRNQLEFSEEALAMLMHYRWPGNVRELRNLTERLAVLCPHEVIGVSDLPSECREEPRETVALSPEPDSGSAPVPSRPAAPVQNTSKLADIEKGHILRVLEACDNNKKLAADKLGIDRSTLYAKLRAYGILT